MNDHMSDYYASTLDTKSYHTARSTIILIFFIFLCFFMLFVFIGLIMWNPLYGFFLFLAATNINKNNNTEGIKNKDVEEARHDILDELIGKKKT